MHSIIQTIQTEGAQESIEQCANHLVTACHELSAALSPNDEKHSALNAELVSELHQLAHALNECDFSKPRKLQTEHLTPPERLDLAESITASLITLLTFGAETGVNIGQVMANTLKAMAAQQTVGAKQC